MIKMPNGGLISPWLKFEMDKNKKLMSNALIQKYENENLSSIFQK